MRAQRPHAYAHSCMFMFMKLGTVVVLDTVSKPIDLGFKRSKVRVRVWVTESAPICISVECTFLLVVLAVITSFCLYFCQFVYLCTVALYNYVFRMSACEHWHSLSTGWHRNETVCDWILKRYTKQYTLLLRPP